MSDGKRDEDATTGIRIVDGKIVRPSDQQILEQQQQPHAMLAEKTGSTGVQRNAAIPVQAPKVDYWAVQAGDGARLDGKRPSALKDKDGTELDVAKVRADAAAKRAADAAREEASAVQSKRKSKVGAKFSKLKPKAAAFQGHANSM